MKYGGAIASGCRWQCGACEVTADVWVDDWTSPPPEGWVADMASCEWTLCPNCQDSEFVAGVVAYNKAMNDIRDQLYSSGREKFEQWKLANPEPVYVPRKKL